MRVLVATAHMYLSWTPDTSKRRESFAKGLNEKLVRALSAGPGVGEFEVYFHSLRQLPIHSLKLMHCVCRADFVQQVVVSSVSAE